LDLTLFSLDVPGFLTGWIKDSATKRRDPDEELPTSVGGEPLSGKMVQSFLVGLLVSPDTDVGEAGWQFHAVFARLDRAIQYAAAYRFNRQRLWNTGSPAFAGDDSGNYSRGAMRPEFCWKPCSSEIRGRREDRVRAAPAVSRAMVDSGRTRAYRFGGNTPAFPAQWLYGLYEFALVTGFLATIISGNFRSRET
jgi:hypothetical protein